MRERTRDAGPRAAVGPTLRALLANGPLPCESVARLGALIADELGRGHARRVSHLALSPEAITIDAGGRPVVADAEPSSESDRYLPSARTRGPTDDVFALGVILYECLAWRQPQDVAADAGIVAARSLGGAFPSVRAVREDVPVWLASAIDRALAPDSRVRFPDGAAFARALGAPRTVAKEIAEVRPSRAPRDLAVAALVALVASSFLLGIARPWASDTPEASVAKAPEPPREIDPPREAPPRPRVEVDLPEKTEKSAKTEPVAKSEARGTKLITAEPSLEVSGALELVGTLGTPRGKHDVNQGMAFAASRNGRVAVTLGKFFLRRERFTEVFVWDVEKSEIVRTFTFGAGRSYDVAALTADGRTAVLAGDNVSPAVLDVESGTIRDLGPVIRAGSVACSSDGKVAVVASVFTLQATVIDLARGVVIRTVDAPLRQCAPALSPDGSRLLLPRQGRFLGLELTDVATGAETLLSAPQGNPGEATFAAFSPDGKRVLATTSNDDLHLVDIPSGTMVSGILRHRVGGHNWQSTSCAFAANGDVLLTGWNFETRESLVRWEPAKGRVETLPLGEASAGVIVPSGERAIVTLGSAPLIWDIEGRNFLRAIPLSFDGHRSPILALAAPSAGERIAIDEDGRVVRWELGRGQTTPDPLRFGGDLPLERRSIRAVSRDGSLLARWSGRTFELFRLVPDVASSITRVTRLRSVSNAWERTGGIPQARFSDDGKWFATTVRASKGQTRVELLVTNIETGEAKTISLADPIEERAPRGFSSFALGPDGEVLVAQRSATERSGRLITLSPSGELLKATISEAFNASQMDVSPDGKLVALLEWNQAGIVRIWSLEENRCVATVSCGASAADDPPCSVAFSKDGGELLVGTERGVVLRLKVLDPKARPSR